MKRLFFLLLFYGFIYSNQEEMTKINKIIHDFPSDVNTLMHKSNFVRSLKGASYLTLGSCLTVFFGYAYIDLNNERVALSYFMKSSLTLGLGAAAVLSFICGGNQFKKIRENRDKHKEYYRALVKKYILMRH